MGLFNDGDEQARKAKLKAMEDRRVAFAQKLAREGFAPEQMLLTMTENGGYAGLCRFEGKFCLVVSPGFGEDADFALEKYDALNVRKERVDVKGEGMNGIFGFGKKPQHGVEYVITRHDGSEVKMSFVGGRSSWLECRLVKNPLLKTQRRRGDANVAWDMKPLDNSLVDAALKVAEPYFG